MKQRIVLVAAIVLAAGGIGFLAGRGVELVGAGLAAPEAVAPETRAAAIRVTLANATPPDRSMVDAALLPAPGTPLLQIHDALVLRARVGDAGAACRLAAEHEACEQDRARVRGVAAQQAQLLRRRDAPQSLPEHSRAEIERQHARLERQRLTLEDELARCDAVTPLSPTERVRYWRQAALAGHVPSMRHYASGSAFRLGELMEVLPDLQTYRREAEPIALRAAHAGDAASMYELALAYASVDNGRRRSFLAQSITPDLAKALAWFQALARHPAVIALPDGHPISTDVTRQLQELRAAASSVETADAARMTAAVDFDTGNPAAAVDLVPGGGIRDTAPADCAAFH